MRKHGTNSFTPFTNLLIHLLTYSRRTWMTHTPNIANFVKPILQQSGLQYVFISSDDCSAVVELEKLLPKYHVVTPCRNVTTGHISSENPRKEHDHLSVLQVTYSLTCRLTYSLTYSLAYC